MILIQRRYNKQMDKVVWMAQQHQWIKCYHRSNKYLHRCKHSNYHNSLNQTFILGQSLFKMWITLKKPNINQMSESMVRSFRLIQLLETSRDKVKEIILIRQFARWASLWNQVRCRFSTITSQSHQTQFREPHQLQQTITTMLSPTAIMGK